METLRLINGNKQVMVKRLPKLFIHGFLNDGGLAHIAENTGLYFRETTGGYEAEPVDSNQIVRLFLTYNFKTRYYDNSDSKNTLHLKHDHHVGFDVADICVKCAKRNRIHTWDLTDEQLISC